MHPDISIATCSIRFHPALPAGSEFRRTSSPPKSRMHGTGPPAGHPAADYIFMFPEGRPYSRFDAPHGREGGPAARGAYLSNYRELGKTTYVLVSAVVRCTTMAAGSSIRRLLFFCEIFCSRGGYCRTLQTAFYDVSRVVQCCRTLQTAFYDVSRVAQCCSTSHTAFYDVSRVVQTSGTVHFHFPRVGELAFPFPARSAACISISRAFGSVHFHFPRVGER